MHFYRVGFLIDCMAIVSGCSLLSSNGPRNELDSDAQLHVELLLSNADELYKGNKYPEAKQLYLEVLSIASDISRPGVDVCAQNPTNPVVGLTTLSDRLALAPERWRTNHPPLTVGSSAMKRDCDQLPSKLSPSIAYALDNHASIPYVLPE